MLERYRKAVAPLPVRIVPENVFCARLSSLPELPPDRICLQFIKEEMYYLVSVLLLFRCNLCTYDSIIVISLSKEYFTGLKYENYLYF